MPFILILVAVSCAWYGFKTANAQYLLGAVVVALFAMAAMGMEGGFHLRSNRPPTNFRKRK